MSDTKRLYIHGLENHLELMDEQNALMELGKLLGRAESHVPINVTGTEDFVDHLKDLGSGMFAVSKWVGGTTIDIFGKALGAAGNGLTRAFSDNATLIKKISSALNRKEDHEVKASKDKVAAITCEGDFSEVGKDMDTLLSTLEQLDQHSKDVLSYLDKKLIAARKLKSVSTTDQVLGIVEEFENIKYPTFHLAHASGETAKSDVLPGGKVWSFTGGASPKYSMSGDAPTGAEASTTFSQSDFGTLLNKLDKVNAMHKRLKTSYDSYLTFIKSWGEMVKSVEANLNKLDKVSQTAHSEAEKILAGDTSALAFYSGFTPRVVSYTDRYIHGVLGVFA